MGAKYELVREELTDPERGAYTAYGVVLKQNGQILRTISDVFFNLAVAEQFISQCNELQLDPIHLDDVIEDLLAQ